MQDISNVAARVPSLEAQIAALQQELSIPRTPSMVQYHALEIQIQTLMQKYTMRETELKLLLEQATQSSQMELFQMQMRHEAAMRSKTQAIAAFQTQVCDTDSRDLTVSRK